MSRPAAGQADARRLFSLVSANEALFAERERLRSRIAGAWSELSRPGCNPPLIFAHLERLRSRQSAVLAQLRANRREARALLGAMNRGPGDEPETWPEPSLN